jgi:hypothetical protein
VAVHAGEYAVTRRQGIDEGHLPRAGTRAREEQDVAALRLEYRLEAVQAFTHQAGEEGAPMIDDGLRHGADDALRNERGAGDLEEGASGHEGDIIPRVRPAGAGVLFSPP